jgi:hypothetical protein
MDKGYLFIYLYFWKLNFMILKIWRVFPKISKIGKIYTNLSSPYFSEMFANFWVEKSTKFVEKNSLVPWSADQEQKKIEKKGGNLEK